MENRESLLKGLVDAIMPQQLKLAETIAERLVDLVDGDEKKLSNEEIDAMRDVNAAEARVSEKTLEAFGMLKTEAEDLKNIERNQLVDEIAKAQRVEPEPKYGEHLATTHCRVCGGQVHHFVRFTQDSPELTHSGGHLATITSRRDGCQCEDRERTVVRKWAIKP